ncbi:hypothetical protein [Butyrivibrio sp. MC2013]|nr:hypothetical protein [Butyrivibrio sp. MC2013]
MKEKLIKEEELIYDGGKVKRTHIADLLVMAVCAVVSIVLIVLGVCLYIY